MPPWLMTRAGRLWAVLLEATLDAYGHAGLLQRLRHPAFVARLLALTNVPPELGPTLMGALVSRAMKSDQERLDVVVHSDRLALVDGRFAPFLAGTPSVSTTPIRHLSKVFLRAPTATDDAKLSSAFDLAFLPLPAPFLEIARRPRTGPRVTTAIALCVEIVFSPLGPSDALANRRASRAFVSDDGAHFYVVVFDEALRQLERLLYRTTPHVDRIAPLQELAQILEDGAKANRGVSAAALARRDATSATVFGQRAHDARTGPAIFHRPRRRMARRVDGFSPIGHPAPFDQGDLFAW